MEKIQSFKNQLDKLQKESSGSVADLTILLRQQEDLIVAVESQISKIRQLMMTRQQFMALITEITCFVTRYSDNVREIGRSGKPVTEKIKKYDEVNISFNISFFIKVVLIFC